MESGYSVSWTEGCDVLSDGLNCSSTIVALVHLHVSPFWQLPTNT